MPGGNSPDRGCYLAEDTQSERTQTSSRSKQEKGFLKSSINHWLTRVHRNSVSNVKGKGGQ